MARFDKFLDTLTPEIAVPLLVLVLLFVLLAIILFKAQQRPDFDVANFLRDETGKESALRAFAFVALAISSWIVATLVIRDKFTPDYFLYYNLTWANTLVLVELAKKWSGILPLSGGNSGASYGNSTVSGTVRGDTTVSVNDSGRVVRPNDGVDVPLADRTDRGASALPSSGVTRVRPPPKA